MSYEGHPDQAFGCVSYAQHGDDLFILNLFKLFGIEHPSWIDVGAHHPTNISNTRLLYDRGARGINIEANPLLFQLFERERPGDVNINIGIAPTAGEMPFYMYDDFSGRNTFSEVEVTLYKRTVARTVHLPVKTLNQIVDTYSGGSFPELLSIDIEGLDFAVLESADFSKSAPLVICVETRRNETAKMQRMLSLKGYVMYARLGENLFFIRADYLPRAY